MKGKKNEESKKVKKALDIIKKGNSLSKFSKYKRLDEVKKKSQDKPKNPIKIKELSDQSFYTDFDEAIRGFLKGKYVARKEWKDYYFCKVNDHGNIMISDPKRYSYRIWIPTLEDFTKNDWIVIDNGIME